MKTTKAIELINSILTLPELLGFYKYVAEDTALPTLFDNVDELISEVDFTAKDLALAVAYGVGKDIISTAHHFYLGVNKFYTNIPRVVKGFDDLHARKWVLAQLSIFSGYDLFDYLEWYRSKRGLGDELDVNNVELKKPFIKYLLENNNISQIVYLVNLLSENNEYGITHIYNSLYEIESNFRVGHKNYLKAILNGDGDKCLSEEGKYFTYCEYADKPKEIRAFTENEITDLVSGLLLRVPTDEIIDRCEIFEILI